MPWCGVCDRFWSPSTVKADGTCPGCGHTIEPVRKRIGGPRPADAPDPGDETLDPLPWHFKALLGAMALYLGYRALQGLEWLVGKL